MAGGPIRFGARGNTTFPGGGGGTWRRTLPSAHLPGALGAAPAALKRTQYAPTPAKPPDPSPDAKCLADYFVFELRDKLMQMFLSLPLHAARPPWIDPPLNALCFHRHRGTGGAGSADAPLALPAVGPAGAFTLVLDFGVPHLYRGILNSWGVDVVQGPAVAAFIEWRIVINGRVVAPFDSGFGAFVGGGVAYFGPPFTFVQPGHLCIQLKSDDQIQLQARNTLAVGAADVAAFIGGWVYQPTIDEPGLVVRGTLTDQQ